MKKIIFVLFLLVTCLYSGQKKYRIRVDLIYESKADFDAFWPILEAELAKTTSLNPGKGNIEKSSIKRHECNNEVGLPCNDEEKREKE